MTYLISVRQISYFLAVIKGSAKAGMPVLLLLSVAFLSSCTPVLNVSNGSNSLVSPPPPDFTQGLILNRSETPLYPLRARTLEIEGWAMVSFSVNANGNVIQNTINVVDSEPEGYFERSSVVAARSLVFENFGDSLVEDVRYVFRYELENREFSRPGFRPPATPQIREMIPRRFITPDYPQAAADQGIGGFVVVEFTVSANGAVSDVVIVENQPQGVFDEVALNAASRLRFEPRLVNGDPVTVENVQYRFDWDPNR